MAEISADTIAELARASFNKTRVRYDGQIELAGTNLFSNPGLMDFDADGSPENVQLGAPEDPVGWGVLISKLDDPKIALSHQDTGPISMRQDYFHQNTDLIDGPPPQDVTKRAKIAAPTAFSVHVDGKADTQLGGGWRGISYGWIMGKGRKAENPFVTKSPFLTNSAPRATFQTTGGQSILVSFEGVEAPKHAAGMYIASTRGQSTEADAANPNTPLYIQKIFDVRAGVPLNWHFVGPMRTTRKAPLRGQGEGPDNNENRTYKGGTNNWPRVQWKKRRTHTKTNGFQTKLSWMYLTETGEPSKPQSPTQAVSTTGYDDKKRMGVYFRPKKHPTNARMWIPLYFNMQSEVWYALKARPIDNWAILHYTNVEKYPEGDKPVAIEFDRANREPDGTGIPGPDSALELSLGDNLDVLDAGRYAVRTVFYDEDGNETAPSTPIVRTIGSGQSLRVGRPRVGNVLYNSDGHEWSAEIVRPKGWEDGIAKDTNVEYGFQMRNTFKIKDTRGLAGGSAAYAKSAWSDVPDDAIYNATSNPGPLSYTVRVLAQFVAKTTGNARVWLETRPMADVSQPTAPQPSDFASGVIPTNYLWEDTKAKTGPVAVSTGTVSTADDISLLRRWSGTEWTFESPTVFNDDVHVGSYGGSSINELKIVVRPNNWVTAPPETNANSTGYITLPAYTQSGGRCQMRVVYGASGTKNFADLRYHFLGKFAGVSRPRTFPHAEDQDNNLEVEVPPESESPNVISGTGDDTFEYRKQGICRLARVPAAERPTALTNSLFNPMRFVEYWGSYGTPRAEEHGIIGYTQPAQANTLYTVSCYLEYRGVTNQTDVLGVGCFDARGTQLSGPFYLKESALGDSASTTNDIGGTTSLVREDVSFTTPANTAYVKIYKSGFSDGFWRVGGFQLRSGASAGTYTFGHDLTGTRTFTFDTGAGVDEGSHLELLGEVAEWLSGGAIFTANDPTSDEYDPSEPDTTVVVEMKSSEYDENWNAYTWHTDFDAVPKHRYWQIRVTLGAEANLATVASAGAFVESTATPRVDSVGLELLRPYTELLRPDGKEYDTPIQVVNFPVPTPERQREMFLSDNNTPRFGLRGKDLHYADGFGLEAYSDAAVRAANWDAIRDEGKHLVEDYYSNRSFLVWLENSPRWAVDREIYKEWDPYYIHRADGLTAVVLEQEALTGEPIFYDE